MFWIMPEELALLREGGNEEGAGAPPGSGENEEGAGAPPGTFLQELQLVRGCGVELIKVFVWLFFCFYFCFYFPCCVFVLFLFFAFSFLRCVFVSFIYFFYYFF